MQRYDFDELTKHECADGEWVKASEAEAEIAALLKQIEVASLRLGILQTENERLRKALEEIVALNSIDYACDDIAREALHLCPEHEHLPLFEVAAMLAAENEALVARIVKLRAVVDAALEIEYILRCSGGSKDVDSFTAQPLRIALNDAGISLWEEEDSE